MSKCTYSVWGEGYEQVYKHTVCGEKKHENTMSDSASTCTMSSMYEEHYLFALPVLSIDALLVA